LWNFLSIRRKSAELASIQAMKYWKCFMNSSGIRRIDFFDENVISVDALQKSWSLVKDVDPKDMLFVALTIEMNGLLWTGDGKLRSDLKAKGFDLFFEQKIVI
jgi:predicted nucleic acid-binding protein